MSQGSPPLALTPLAHGWKQRALGHLGWARGALGAGAGVALAGGATWLLLRLLALPADAVLPFLVAPLGASAVLVFCVPASPLAQPWAVVGGDLISAAVGLAAGHALGDPWAAGTVGVALAITAMSLARCLHPPGGACALLCALGASATPAWGWTHFVPIAANVAVLCGVGWFYNNLTGHPWPHRPPRVPPAPAAPYTREDITAVMAEWNEVLDVDIDDLDAFVQALLRRGGQGGDPAR